MSLNNQLKLRKKKAGHVLLLLLFAACHVQAAHPDILVGVYYYPWHTGTSFYGGNPAGAYTALIPSG